MFQFGWCPSQPYGFRLGCHPLPDGGLPHSDIRGSQLASSSPRLFAANHVLHRHSTPRHPPHAPCSFFFCPPSCGPIDHQALLPLGEAAGPSQPDPISPRWDPSIKHSLIDRPSGGTRRVLASVVKVQMPAPSKVTSLEVYPNPWLTVKQSGHGGDAGIRTPCLLRAKQALFQMSYIPWWGILDSNQGPQSYQDCALTT